MPGWSRKDLFFRGLGKFAQPLFGSSGLRILTKTANQQLKALRSGKISAVELLDLTISRAEEIAPQLNPFALPLYGRARQAAQEADKKL